MRSTLVEAARLDSKITGEALVAASGFDPLAMSKAILGAAKIDPDIMQATLESGSAGAALALAALGAEVPVEAFLSENAPIAGTDPATGEVWEVVAQQSASVVILAKFPRGKPGAQVDVIDILVLPDDVAPLPQGETVSSFVQIIGENFNQGDLRATHVTFPVSKIWLQENDIHPWAVSFNRYDDQNGSWNSFDAKRSREDAEFVYYTATPPGFSLWAVSGRSDVEQVDFRVDSLSIDPLEIRERQEVIVQAQVTNLGDDPMIHNATLWLNGRV
jgi:PGF-pre-PGF domain-containing protein